MTDSTETNPAPNQAASSTAGEADTTSNTSTFSATGQSNAETGSQESSRSTASAQPNVNVPADPTTLAALEANSTVLPITPTVTPATAAPVSTSAQAASNTVSVSADHLRAHLDSHLEKVPSDSEFARLIAKFKETLADIENFIHTEVLPKL